jgi:hypothetical protein
MLFLQHQKMVDSYSLNTKPSKFLEKIQDDGDILVGCENHFLPSTFQKRDFLKKIFCVLVRYKILKNHGRAFFDNIKNVDVNQDGGFQNFSSPIFEKNKFYLKIIIQKSKMAAENQNGGISAIYLLKKLLKSHQPSTL